MGPAFGLLKLRFASSGDHILLMPDIIVEHFRQAQHLRFAICNGHHYHADRLLKVGVFEQRVQHLLGINVLF